MSDTHLAGAGAKVKTMCGRKIKDVTMAKIFGPRPTCQDCWEEFQKRGSGRLKQAYQVKILIQQFEYDPKVGSYKREIIDANVESEHGNWPIGDYSTLAEADAAVKALITPEA